MEHWQLKEVNKKKYVKIDRANEIAHNQNIHFFE